MSDPMTPEAALATALDKELGWAFRTPIRPVEWEHSAKRIAGLLAREGFALVSVEDVAMRRHAAEPYPGCGSQWWDEDGCDCRAQARRLLGIGGER